MENMDHQKNMELLSPTSLSDCQIDSERDENNNKLNGIGKDEHCKTEITVRRQSDDDQFIANSETKSDLSPVQSPKTPLLIENYALLEQIHEKLLAKTALRKRKGNNNFKSKNLLMQKGNRRIIKSTKMEN